MGVEESDVGRDAVAGFEPDQIAWDDFLGIDFHDLSITFHRGADFEEFLECLGAAFGFPFLDITDEGVQSEDAGDEYGVREAAREQGEEGG